MRLIDHLPGIPLAVGEVTRTLAHMWEGDLPQGAGEAPGNPRASQLNLILHFGMKTPPEEAQDRFQVAIRFAQKTPCRIIVLCPQPDQGGEVWMDARLFSQCYLGPSMREMCCCEALMISYPTRAFVHLQNQVSVWLEGDLPIYHWFHRVPEDRIRAQYLGFVQGFRRVLYDGAVEGENLTTLAWPDPRQVRDLAEARLLASKQSVGPFLAGYSPGQLVDGLVAVEVVAGPGWGAEAKYLRNWVLEGVRRCGAQVREQDGGGAREPMDRPGLRVQWRYGDGRFFLWEWLAETGQAQIRADFGLGLVEQQQLVAAPTPEAVLSEAVFFQ